MAALSDYLAARLASLLFNNNDLAFASPGDGLYLAVFTSGLGLKAGILTGEVDGGAYARPQVPASAWARTANSVANSVAVEFPVATGAWGTLTHGAIMDSPTPGAGNVLAHGALYQPRSIQADDQLRFLEGEVTFDVE